MAIKLLLLLRVTVGVLQASLALEEELSLKAQLQKLLTVAKNLFTHLGENHILEGLASGNPQPIPQKLLTALKGHCDWLVLSYSKQETSSGRNQMFVKCEILWSSNKSESYEGDSKYVKDKRKSTSLFLNNFLQSYLHISKTLDYWMWPDK